VIAGFESARQILGPRSWRIAYAGLILAEVGFAIGLIVGAMGWVRLTRFVTGGVVLAVFGAIAWRVFYKAAVAVLPFLIRAPLAHVGEGSRRQEPLLRRVAAALIGIFAVYRYGTSVLDAFRLLTPLRNRVDTVLSASYDWGGLELSLGSTLAAMTILIFTPILSRIVRFVLREEIAPRLGIAHGVDYTLTTLSGYAVWVLGIVAAANAAGVSGTQMTVLFGALGVGLGFGLQAIVNNFVSGLILMFERPLAVGDRIQTATQAGTVTAIGIRASNIRTFSGADVVVPNGDLITKEVINWTLSDDIRRVEIKVSTSYGTRPRQVLEILTRLAADHPKVLDEPAFAAVMHSFGESALNFELRAWVGGNDFVSVASELHVLVEEALTGAGIDLVVPRREVLLRNEKDETEGS
jgi:small-conductance mechanosensitive channel